MSNRPPHPAMGVEQTRSLEDFWIDPAKDYLCVFREMHVRRGQPWRDNPNWTPVEPEGDPKARPKGAVTKYDEETQIVELGRTPDGRRYPARFQKKFAAVVDGRRYGNHAEFAPVYTLLIRLDAVGAVPNQLFEWPADVPGPHDLLIPVFCRDSAIRRFAASGRPDLGCRGQQGACLNAVLLLRSTAG